MPSHNSWHRQTCLLNETTSLSMCSKLELRDAANPTCTGRKRCARYFLGIQRKTTCQFVPKVMRQAQPVTCCHAGTNTMTRVLRKGETPPKDNARCAKSVYQRVLALSTPPDTCKSSINATLECNSSFCGQLTSASADFQVSGPNQPVLAPFAQLHQLSSLGICLPFCGLPQTTSG